MPLATLQELEPTTRRTIVVNVNTDLVATRALLSAMKVVADPVLLVNCDPTDAGRRTFERLRVRHPFDLIEAPIRDHGATLDWLFSSLRDEFLLLLDSDAEVLEAAFVARLRSAFAHPRVFGAGFTWGPFYLSPELGAPQGFFYMERPWLPCVMFRRSAIQQALDAGHSFLSRSVPNDIGLSPRISRFLGARIGPPWTPRSVRFEQLPGWVRRRMASWELDRLFFIRGRYHGQRPRIACFDTGADIYHYLRFQKELLFSGLPMELIDGEVHHYSGVTRNSMFGPFLLDTDERAIEGEVVARLAERYGYRWEPASVC